MPRTSACNCRSSWCDSLTNRPIPDAGPALRSRRPIATTFGDDGSSHKVDFPLLYWLSPTLQKAQDHLDVKGAQNESRY
jgi:hypothetical protein